MKKTLSIHLGRQLFVIEEDAFDRLQQYLKRLETSLKGETGVADIIEDIEMRFAELLHSYLGETRKVVTIEDVEQAISSLGEPEEISEDASQDDTQERPYSYNYSNAGQRKFFRDTDNGVLAGVCSGLAAYMNIDPVIVRLIFILLLFAGIAIPTYIILWIIIPNAKTPSERLQMHGRPVTVDALKDEFIKAADRMKDDTLRARDRFREGGDHIAQRTRQVAKLISKLIGIGLIGFAGVGLLIFTLVTTGIIDVVPTTGDEQYTSLHDFLQLVAPSDNTFTLMWWAILIVGLCGPILAILIGIRLLLEKSNRFFKINFIVLPVLIGTGLCCGLISGLQTGRDFAMYAEIENQHLTTNTDHLIIEELPHYTNNHRIITTGGIDFIHIRHGRIHEEGVLIRYKQSDDSLFHIRQIFSAHGVDRSMALKRSGRIQHTVQLLGQKLVIDPQYAYPISDQFREQEVEVIIEIPKGKQLTIKNFNIKDPAIEHRGMLHTDEPFEVWE